MFPETTQQIPGVGIFPCTTMITSSSAPTIQHLELYEKFQFVFPQGLPVYRPATKPSSTGNILNKIIRRVPTLRHNYYAELVKFKVKKIPTLKESK
jgi:hypothetical protein